MKKFSKILTRRLTRAPENGETSSPSSRDSSPDFHQLTSSRGNVKGTKRLPKQGSSRIIATIQNNNRSTSNTNGGNSNKSKGNGVAIFEPSTNASEALTTTSATTDEDQIAGSDQANAGEDSGPRNVIEAPVFSICSICESINFTKILDWKPGDPRPWISLSHCLLNHDCPFCVFFQTMIGLIPESDDEGRVIRRAKFTPYLRIRLAFERLGGLKEKSELGKAVMIEVTTKTKSLPWGYIIRAQNDDDSEAEKTQEQVNELDGYLASRPEIRGRTVTPLLNSAVPKAWIDFCKKNHASEACGRTAKNVENLHLVDCQDRRVVAAADLSGDVEYATLSYVSDDLSDSSTLQLDTTNDSLVMDLPNIIPQVFLDGLALSRSLGYRYLWIDRYCIPKDDLAAKAQLRAKDSIFSNSAVTLIVASGNSVYDGIPGISVPREDQLSLKTDRGLYTTTLLRPDLDVAASNWASRASTYNDGVLARRRLVFTQSQVYFQCQCLHCPESMSLPLSLAPTVNLGRMFPEGGAGTQPSDLKNHIRSYIPKEFSSEQERLDDFRSMLQYYQTHLRTENFLGLPLFPGTEFRTLRLPRRTDQLAVALGWMPDRTIPHEGYTAPYFQETNASFPSWTWLSWRLRQGATTLSNQFHFNLVDEGPNTHTLPPILTSGPTTHSSTSAPATPTAMSPTLPSNHHHHHHGLHLHLGKHGADGAATPPTLTKESIVAAPRLEISIGYKDDRGVLSWELDSDKITEENISFLRLETYCFDISIIVEKRPSEGQQQQQETGGTEAAISTDMVKLGDLPLEKCCQDAIKGWFVASASLLPSSEDNDASTTATDEATKTLQYEAVGLLLAGRNWGPEAQPGGGATSVLVCARERWASEGKFKRVGALKVPFQGFSMTEDGEGSATLKGVSGDGKMKKDLTLRRRLMDIF